MDNGAKQQFQIYLPGLLKVLAENLYSSKKVAVRELLQNAHDSTVRRSVEGNDTRFKPRIDMWLDPKQRTLRIADNGSGLTEDDMKTYLSTIGRSYTRELSEKLSILSPEEASRLIGQFGLGFLSAFLVANEVTLTSRSMQPGSPALRWRSSGDVHYEITPGEREEIGTTVELQIKPNASFLINEELLRDTIQQYADFLPIPIYVNGDKMPANLMQPPWESSNLEYSIRDYIERVFKAREPLAIIPLTDQVIDLGHDQLTIALQGFLFIPPHSVASSQEYGDMNVFIRRMFICDHQMELLPPWARFVRGVVDCPELQPTASREEIHQDDSFQAVQQALEQQLLSGLRKIANEEPATWQRIVDGHASLITRWAVRDNEFFQQVADIVTFQTSRGTLNLPDYLELTNNTLYYVGRQLGSLQEQLLGEGRGVPVIDASWNFVLPFLEKYAITHPGVAVMQMDGDSRRLMRPVPDVPFMPLLNFYSDHQIRARMVTFKPEEVPALIMYPKDAEFIIESRNALDSGALPGPLAGLVGKYMSRLDTTDDDLRGTLYLNASNLLVKQLSETPPAEATRNAILIMIYQIARLFAARTMTPADVQQAFSETVKAMALLAAK